ncbi:MAG: DUF4440 domain-containing protein [Gemmatimonadota bacterium]|nr:MAG: DUF4440 domain-containing protein [Gemmatimonadota bacterium]
MGARTNLVAVLALVAASTACQSPAREVAALSEEDRSALEGIMQEWARSALAGDVEAWAGLWVEDGVKMNPNAPAIEGIEAIRAGFSGLNFTEFTIAVEEIDGRGDLAYVRGTFTATATVEGMPEPMVEDGKYLTVLRKSPDGTWLVAIDCWNSDLPPPEAG